MPTKYTLMTPGPVPLPPEVLASLSQPMVHHRTPEFMAIFQRVLERLKQVFFTSQSVFIHTSTGSGAMESALVNVLSPGDEVIAVISGKFGERWAEMAEVFGMKVQRLEVPWGRAARPEAISEMLKKHPQTKAVLCQACETSTGVLHPVREIAEVVSSTKALFIVDAITALGALKIPMDEWKIDVMIGGAQKAFMLPTGIAFISFSKKAWAHVETARCPRFYFDIRSEKEANDNGESHFSAAVSHIRALDVVLDQVLHRGLDTLYARIQALSDATLLAARELELHSFPEIASPSLTALQMPADVDGQKVRAEMEKTHFITVMGGQDQLKGKIIRIGHMGAISDDDLEKTLRALAASINVQKASLISETKVEKAIKAARARLK